MESKTLKLRQFYEVGKEMLRLTVECGEEFLDRSAREVSFNRPGLALTGFRQYFANNRIQVFGLAETTYLKSLEAPERARRLEDFFRAGIPCLVFTRNRRVPKEIEALAKRYEVPVLRSGMITSELINRATVLMDNLTAPEEQVQGSMIDIKGVGVLLRGAAQIGKSETALGLIELGHSLVADDVTRLRRASWGALIGSAVSLTRFHMEIRGIGIIHVPSLYGVTSVRGEKQLDMVVHLYRPEDPAFAEGAELPATTEFLGLSVPIVFLPVLSGRDMAHVVEVAALNQRLKVLGHDAAKELDEKVVSALTRKQGRGD